MVTVGFIANLGIGGIVLFLIGLVLFIIEMASPGFGVFGFCGLLCFAGSVAITAADASQALVMSAFIFGVTALCSVVVLILASKGVLPRWMVLKQDIASGAGNDPGFEGREGVCVTELRPSGTVEIDGKRLDAVSDCGFIEKGTRVKVTSRRHSSVVVVPANSEQ